MNDIEKILLQKCRNGDVDSFEKLISSYQKKIYNLCYRYFNNNEDAADLAQEVFIKVFKSLKDFKEESSISTWIYKIAATTCIDELRKRKKHGTVSIDDEDEDKYKLEIPDNSSNPDEKFEQKEFRKEIETAIGSLSEGYKTVIILRDLQGLSYEDIAQITGIPLGTVKSRIRRARMALKEYLLNKGNFFKKVSSN